MMKNMAAPFYAFRLPEEMSLLTQLYTDSLSTWFNTGAFVRLAACVPSRHNSLWMRPTKWSCVPAPEVQNGSLSDLPMPSVLSLHPNVRPSYMADFKAKSICKSWWPLDVLLLYRTKVALLLQHVTVTMGGDVLKLERCKIWCSSA